MDPTTNWNNWLAGQSYLETSYADTGNPSSSAKGYFQFIDSTAKRATDAGLPDPRAGGYADQANAAKQYIQAFHPDAADAIGRGDFRTASGLLRDEWPSLPGGSQQQSPDRYGVWSQILNGQGPRPEGVLSGKNTMADPGALSSNAAPPQPNGALTPGGYQPNTLDTVGDTLQGMGAGLASIYNPGGAAALYNTIAERNRQRQEMAVQNRPQLVDMGTDLFGQKSYGLYNPVTQQMTRPNGPVGGASLSDQGGMPDTTAFMATLRRYQNGQATTDDVVNAAPALVQQYAKDLVAGRVNPTFLGARAAQMKEYALPIAHIIDPTFNENDITTRQTMARNLGNQNPSAFGGQINGVNTVMAHMKTMSDAMDVLKQEGVLGGTVLNRPLQAAADYTGYNPKVQAALQSYQQGLQGVAGEMRKITAGGNGSLAELEDWKNGMQPWQPEAKLRAGLATMVDMMHGRLDANVAQYNNAFHTQKSARDFMTPMAQASEDRVLGADQYGPQGKGGQQQAAPEVRYDSSGKAWTRDAKGNVVPFQQ